MGDAKRKQTAKALETVEGWLFPPSEWEIRTVSEIQTMPSVTVYRMPQETFQLFKLARNNCHQNASEVQAITGGGMEHIVGWWLQDEHYILHSVVRRGDRFFCVTPAGSFEPFTFVPDSTIECREEGRHRPFYREGVLLHKGLRVNPTKTIAYHCGFSKNSCANNSLWDLYSL
jgi:hypothetical protein